MAQEKIVSINTAPAVKNIGELRKTISEYKKSLEGLDLGQKEYQETLQKLQAAQAMLRNAMHGTTADFKELTNAATGANVAFDENNKLVKKETLSYNELVRGLDILKQEWRSTTDEADRAKLTKRIKAVNDELKSMDASVGVFGRNVGNYVGSLEQFTQAFGKMGKGAQGIIGPLSGVTAGFKTLSATPAIAILGVLANILQKVIDALETSEKNTEDLTKAMAPFAAIGDAVTKMLQGLGNVLVSVVGWFGKLTQAILKNNDATEKRLALAEKEKTLEDDLRANQVQNAKDQRDIAELRSKAAEKDKYTAKERLEFLEAAGKKEEEIADRQRKAAKDAYDALVLKTSLTDSSKEEMDALAAAEAEWIKADTDYFNTVRSINSGIAAARREEAKDARDAAKAVKDAATAKIAAEKEYLEQLLSITKTGSESELALRNEIAARERDKQKADAKQKITNATELARSLALIDKAYQVQIEKNQQDHDNKVLAGELQSIANRRDALQKGSVEYAEAQKEYAAKALDGMRQQMDETDAEFRARKLAAQRALVEAGNAMTDALVKETIGGLKAQMAAVADGSVEYLALAVEAEKAELEGMYQGIDESLDEFNARRLEKTRAVREAEDALEEAVIDRDRIILEQRMVGLEEGSAEYLSMAIELKQFELDSLHQLEGESNEAFRLRELQAEKEFHDARKALWKASLNIMQQAAAGVSSILGTIADAYENNTKMTKREAEKAKNLRIAGATIDMLQGAVTAYSTAQSLGVPWGPIIGAINAAAVVATGVANIAKIKSTQVSTSGSGGGTDAVIPAAVNAPTVTPEVNQVRTITSDSEEERFNQMASEQRVYILDSDIQARNDAHKVTVEQTTF